MPLVHTIAPGRNFTLAIGSLGASGGGPRRIEVGGGNSRGTGGGVVVAHQEEVRGCRWGRHGGARGEAAVGAVAPVKESCGWGNKLCGRLLWEHMEVVEGSGGGICAWEMELGLRPPMAGDWWHMRAAAVKHTRWGELVCFIGGRGRHSFGIEAWPWARRHCGIRGNNPVAARVEQGVPRSAWCLGVHYRWGGPERSSWITGHTCQVADAPLSIGPWETAACGTRSRSVQVLGRCSVARHAGRGGVANIFGKHHF
jgi:hypothetical protein